MDCLCYVDVNDISILGKCVIIINVSYNTLLKIYDILYVLKTTFVYNFGKWVNA